MADVEIENENQQDESFRDRISTISEEGKRNWIFALKPKGKLYNARSILSYIYLVLFFSLPFIRINGNPVFLFNVIERKFVFFSVIFWPQDFFIFGLGMITFILFIVLFTVVYGRVFCGWACPQTIFMEMVFRKIEYWIDGDAPSQRALKKAPWDKKKLSKRLLKHTLFFFISFIISNTFLAYIIGSDELLILMNEPVSANIGTLVALIIFTGVFYGVYAWFREQVCLIVCPYGRLQGVMLDKNSIVVAYDYKRGEPRGKFKKNEERTKGDCIDCNLCVKVCPTGIDIRNGTQLECVNCTACIDVCDNIMDKTGLPKGLIRYASENGIAKGEKLRFTPRIRAYTVVLTILIGVLVTLLVTRTDLDATILRTPGMLYQKHEAEGTISNLYNLKLINKTHNDMPIELRLEGENEGSIKMIGENLTVPKESKAETEFFIYLPKNKISSRKTMLKIAVYSGGKKIQTVKTNFLGPTSSK